MKILVNVARELLDRAADWNECEAFRLGEMTDGSFSLVVTNDLERSREAESKRAAAEAGIADMLAGTSRTEGQ